MRYKKLKEDASAGATSSGSIATFVGSTPAKYYAKPPMPNVKSNKEIMDIMIKRLASESTISLEEKRQMLESWFRQTATNDVSSTKQKLSSKYSDRLKTEIDTIFENITITRK